MTIIPHPFYYSDDFLKNFQYIRNLNFIKGSKVDFKLRRDNKKKKINPILKIAKPKDAKIITALIKVVYEGTYPYKEMEDEEEVRKMIESGKSIFILFKNKQNETIGTTAFVLDFEAKRGNMRTWVVKKEYQGNFESTKSFIGCCIYVWLLFKKEILLWYGEVRTAHAKTQYILDLCSLKVVGFCPNKDVFYNQVESDILQVSYNKKALREYRCKNTPKILPEVENIFLFLDQRYNLGEYEVFIPKINLDRNKMNKIKKNLSKKIMTEKFGYMNIKLFINNSDSFIKFLYTPTVQNFEKTKFKVNNLEELYVFLQEFKKCAEELNVRYFEVYVSAYNPYYQKIFYDAGLFPRGYVPSWEYNSKKKCFEDRILFNYFKGEIDKNMTLFKENKKLIEYLNFKINK